MRTLAYLGVWAVLAAGCATAPVHVTLADAEKELSEILSGLDSLRWNENRSAASQYRSRADELSRRRALGRQIAIESLFASADASRMLNDRGRLAETQRTLAALSPGHPLALVVASWLESDPNKSLQLLDTAPSEPHPHPRVLFEKALLLAHLNRHAEAVGNFDAALEGLPRSWRNPVATLREKSWVLRRGPPENATVNSLLDRATIRTTEFTQAVAEWTPNPRGLNLGPDGSTLTRARLALWILHLVVERERNPGLRTRYAERLAARPGSRSPIADVAAGSPYLDAAMIAVERDFMRLPDGRNFFPDQNVSGLELKAVLDRVRNRYP